MFQLEISDFQLELKYTMFFVEFFSSSIVFHSGAGPGKCTPKMKFSQDLRLFSKMVFDLLSLKFLCWRDPF